jgi:hypothetical protein
LFATNTICLERSLYKLVFPFKSWGMKTYVLNFWTFNSPYRTCKAASSLNNSKIRKPIFLEIMMQSCRNEVKLIWEKVEIKKYYNTKSKIYLYVLSTFTSISFLFMIENILFKSFLLCHNFSTSIHVAQNTNKPFNKLWYSKKWN